MLPPRHGRIELNKLFPIARQAQGPLLIIRREAATATPGAEYAQEVLYLVYGVLHDLKKRADLPRVWVAWTVPPPTHLAPPHLKTIAQGRQLHHGFARFHIRLPAGLPGFPAPLRQPGLDIRSSRGRPKATFWAEPP